MQQSHAFTPSVFDVRAEKCEALAIARIVREENEHRFIRASVQWADSQPLNEGDYKDNACRLAGLCREWLRTVGEHKLAGTVPDAYNCPRAFWAWWHAVQE